MENSVVNYLAKIADRYPDNIAISSENIEVSFEDYDKNARKIGTWLINHINQFNRPIALYLPKSEKVLFCMMGILYSGNYYCPIAYNSPEDRVTKILKRLDLPYVITDESNKEYIEKIYGDEKVLLIDNLMAENEDANLIQAMTDKVIDTDPVYVLFTSGSTGEPKGVVLPHRAVIDYIEWAVERFYMDDSTVLGSQAPFHFDASMPDIFIPLFTGGRLHLLEEKKFLFPTTLIKELNRAKVNTLIWVPSALILISNNDVFSREKLNDVRLIMFCGEVMPTKHLNYWRKYLPGSTYVNLYGPTEAAYACTYYIIDRDFTDDETLPIGKACANERVFLLDDNNKIINDSGLIGEICIQGTCLAKGYYNMCSDSFQFMPFLGCYKDAIYRTGDLGSYNDVYELECLGRKDSQIKHMGYRIELGEIEVNVLSIKGIRNACVLYDKERDEIVLFYEADAICDKAYIIKRLSNKIPKYMYPSKYYRYDSIPINANGKVDRTELNKVIYGGA